MKHGRSPYTSTFYMWNDASAFLYASCVTPLHCHNTMQLILDIQNSFRFRLKNERWKTYKSLIIKENVVHQLDTNNSVQLIIYLGAETNIAKKIKLRCMNGNDTYSPGINIFHLVNANELQQALLNPNPLMLKILINKILNSLSGETGAPKTDERISIIEQVLSTTDPAEVTVKLLAQKVFLSESRLRALFKEVTGIPLYHYFLWNKVRFAINQIMAGASVKDAAIEAGFTDNSHLNKVMMQMFGISPSQFIKDNKTRNTVTCDTPALHFETIYE